MSHLGLGARANLLSTGLGVGAFGLSQFDGGTGTAQGGLAGQRQAQQPQGTGGHAAPQADHFALQRPQQQPYS